MSRMISVFCDTDVSLDEIRHTIEETLQITLSMNTVEGVGAVLEGGSNGALVTVFGDHGLEDDCGIEFTKHSIEIDFTDGYSEENLIENGLKTAKRISEQFQCTTIVVGNLQHLKATYYKPVN